MSRHRDVRCMDYMDEYDGYNDIYGHSLEDDYCVSPSVQQFLPDQCKRLNIASFMSEPGIVEGNEDIETSASVSEEKCNLSEWEKAKLETCLTSIRHVIGDSVPESTLREKIIASGFDTTIALDAILISSQTNLTDSTENKEQLESHPGVSVHKPNTHMFTIPKLSFKKEHNLPKESVTHYSDNVDNLKSVGPPLATFSSLAGLISDHNRHFTNSDATKVSSQHDTNLQSFGSLAALTAHHLQKSNTSTTKESEFQGQKSSSSQFVIPKLSIKKDNKEIDEKSKMPLISTGSTEKSSINLIQKDFLNIHIVSENSTVDITLKKDLENPISVIDEIRSSSPENWVIDLSTALRETDISTDSTMHDVNTIALKKLRKFYFDMPNSEMCIGDKNNIILNMLPVTLNLCTLRHINLPYTKKNASVFGRILCRKWKTKKPILKDLTKRNNIIKRFDFSVSYKNTNRS